MNKSGTPSPNPEAWVATPQMNNRTHKVLEVSFYHDINYAVPKDWEMEDISFLGQTLYYKGVKQDVPKNEINICNENINSIGWSEEDVEDYFDCEGV